MCDSAQDILPFQIKLTGRCTSVRIPEYNNKKGHRVKNMLFSELKCKDVINIRDCKKLGRVCDLEFDECTGCIRKIMVPGCNKMFSFMRCEPDIVICFKDIKQIGPDIILVDVKC